MLGTIDNNAPTESTESLLKSNVYEARQYVRVIHSDSRLLIVTDSTQAKLSDSTKSFSITQRGRSALLPMKEWAVGDTDCEARVSPTYS